jgi:hypothetical protein
MPKPRNTGPAWVTAYSHDPFANRLKIKVECSACASEWGWADDVPSQNDRLEEMARSHNSEVHGIEPTRWEDI